MPLSQKTFLPSAGFGETVNLLTYIQKDRVMLVLQRLALWSVFSLQGHHLASPGTWTHSLLGLPWWYLVALILWLIKMVAPFDLTMSWSVSLWTDLHVFLLGGCSYVLHRVLLVLWVPPPSTNLHMRSPLVAPPSILISTLHPCSALHIIWYCICIVD